MTPVYNHGSFAAALEDALYELIAEADVERGRIDDKQELEDVGKLIGIFPLADEEAVRKLFSGHREHGDLFRDFEMFVHLPLVRHTKSVMHPVMTFEYHWPKHVLRLRVALFYRPPSEDPPGPLRAFGLRFETPEHWAGELAAGAVASTPDGEMGGHHDMFHAQPVRHLYKGSERTKLPGLEWLNTEQPSVPVSAADTSGLLLAALVSIYGRKRVVERYRNRKLQALKRVEGKVSGFPDPPVRPQD